LEGAGKQWPIAYFCGPVRKQKTQEIIPAVPIIDVTQEGKAVARHEGMVYFVDHAVPGDVADLLVRKKKKNYGEATVSRFCSLSDLRTQPRCEHFGTCGGCKWQNASYDAQLQWKQKTVEDAFQRIGHLPVDRMSPIAGCEHTYFYRNKLEFTFSDRKWLPYDDILSGVIHADNNALGFHIPGMFDKVLDLQNCYLQEEPSNAIRAEVRRYAGEHGLSFFNIRKQEGFLRTLMIRSTSTGEVMVVLSVFEFLEAELFALLKHLRDRFPAIKALLYTHNAKKNDSMDGLEVRVFHGDPYITEQMEDLRFRISAKSFFQTNSGQALRLYQMTREFANLTGKENVYDLYAGTGTIANFVARNAAFVTGIEYVEDAVKDARVNAGINNITNTAFYAGDMKDVLSEALFAARGKPDVIITDPPRAGMHEDVVNAILRSAPRRIVYVSCNPATQARDIAMMASSYSIEKIQPVDMFPQTAHVENIAVLERLEETRN
jgi:23S rRNA (uracil1939-C5)-methyltransferase